MGGQWLLAATPPYKQDHRGFLDYLCGQLEKLGVERKLGKRVTATMVAEHKPEVVIVATGAKPLTPRIPGVEQKGVITAWDVLQGHKVGHRVLVIGGGMTGLETAEFLAGQGKEGGGGTQRTNGGAAMGATCEWQLKG